MRGAQNKTITGIPRRGLLLIAGGACLGVSAMAQQGNRHHVLGWFGTTTPMGESYNRAFVGRLAELGFVEHRNLRIEFRSARVSADKVDSAAAELGRQGCNLIFAPGTSMTLTAVMKALPTMPVAIVATDYDPIATGAVATMAKPGGRVTGVSLLQTELPAKRLELLKVLLPRVRRVGVMADAASADQLSLTRAAAPNLNLELVVHEFGTPPHDFAQAFATFDKGRAEAVMALGSAYFVPGRERIPALALNRRLPAVFHNSIWAEHGGLLSYGPNFEAAYRRAAELVAKLLNGAVPADVPIEQPSQVELVLNQRTARALGVGFPSTLLTRADRVID